MPGGAGQVVVDGSGDVREAPADAQVHAALHGLSGHQQGDMLPGVVRAVMGRIAAVVGGDHEDVLILHEGQDVWELLVEALQGLRVPLHVPAVAVEHVEVHQVGEDEAARAVGDEPLRGGDARLVVLGVVHQVDTSVAEDVLDLADGHHGEALGVEAVQDGVLKGRDGVILPVLGADVLPVLFRKGTGDDPAHQVFALQHLPGDLADAIELLKGDDLFAGGHLEHAVGGGVNYGLAGRYVLVAQALDDLGAAGYLVAQGAPADLRLELVHEDLGEAVGEGLEGGLLDEARHLPVTAGGVLGVGHLHALAVSALHGSLPPGQRAALYVADTQFAHVGDVQGMALLDMAQGVGPHVVEFHGVGQLADAHAVQNDQNSSLAHMYSSWFRFDISISNPKRIDNCSMPYPGR